MVNLTESRNEYSANLHLAASAAGNRADAEAKAKMDKASQIARDALSKLRDKQKAEKKSKFFGLFRMNEDVQQSLAGMAASSLTRALKARGIVSPIVSTEDSTDTDQNAINGLDKDVILNLRETGRHLGSDEGVFDTEQRVLCLIFKTKEQAEKFAQEAAALDRVSSVVIQNRTDKSSQIVPQQGNTDFESDPVSFGKGFFIVHVFLDPLDIVPDLTEMTLSEAFENWHMDRAMKYQKDADNAEKDSDEFNKLKAIAAAHVYHAVSDPDKKKLAKKQYDAYKGKLYANSGQVVRPLDSFHSTVTESVIDNLRHAGGGAYKNISGETIAIRRNGQLRARKTKDPSHQAIIGHKLGEDIDDIRGSIDADEMDSMEESVGSFGSLKQVRVGKKTAILNHKKEIARLERAADDIESDGSTAFEHRRLIKRHEDAISAIESGAPDMHAKSAKAQSYSKGLRA